MMVSVETYLLRGKRRWLQLSERPGFRLGSNMLLYGGGGFLLSSASLWQHMQPFAAGLAAGCGGLWAGFAAAGGILGYQWFWGERGVQGMFWILGALALGYLVRKRAAPERQTELLTVGSALLTAIIGLACRLWLGDDAPPDIYLLRILLAAASACLFSRFRESRERMSLWLISSLGVLALAETGNFTWLNLGCVAAGAIAAAAPLTAAALAGIGLEAAGLPFMTAGLCTGCFLRMLPIRDQWRRLVSPSAGCLIALVLGRYWDTGCWLGISLGGILGAAVPWRWSALYRRSGTGNVQVQLEQAARLFQQMQRTLLDPPVPAIDQEGLLNQLRVNACGSCSFRGSCREKDLLTVSVLSDPFSVKCRKNGRLLGELRRCRDQIRLIKGQRKRLGEYRGALVQQYGFLSGYLQLMADRLTTQIRFSDVRFRVQVGARSTAREPSNGDVCLAFPGVGLRFYVLLCDGMGTGLGAAEEGRHTAELMKQMLTAGLPPQYAMGTVNTHLALRGQAGAVTMDLAEIRLDTGRAAIYKWGAAPSILVKRNRTEKIGTVTPPPGISVTEARETVARLSLRRGEVLVLTSDGMDLTDTSGLAELAGSKTPGELAGYILREYGGSGEDDATAAVIRLRPVNLTT